MVDAAAAARTRADQAYDVAIETRADLAAHVRGCTEAAERTSERLDEVKASVAEVKQSLKAARDEDRVQRGERQKEVDKSAVEREAKIDARLAAMEAWNRRIAMAIVGGAITLALGVLGKALVLPLVGAALGG